LENKAIYEDIAKRTQGDIYVGVVGPVRTGKSTFIKKFMETLVLPNIPEDSMRQRAQDELPQSAAGRTIMTTEPKFIPEESVTVRLDEAASFDVRMIDCVGYIVPSALGYVENNAPRMVMSPWFDKEIPFNMAAEIGTRKVIQEHSTIGLLVTTDGSISDIPRAEYAEAEERVVRELQEIDKPFAVLLNCQAPRSPAARALQEQLQERYGVPVVAVNCLELQEADVREILGQVLYQFPVRELAVDLPRWAMTLQRGHWLRTALYDQVRGAAAGMHRMADVRACAQGLCQCEYVQRVSPPLIDLGQGTARVAVELQADLFYRVLGEATGLDIGGEEGLFPCMIELARIKKEYDRVRGALEEVEATGYGIVMPGMDQLKLEEPEIVRQGGRYGVRLRASAPSIHMMRADIITEVAPVVGSEKQSQELVTYLLGEFEDNPRKIWESNIFGKSLHELVNEGLRNKLYRMPADARLKMQETIERIINEGCSGLICIIL